jgi:hypothetical protein
MWDQTLMLWGQEQDAAGDVDVAHGMDVGDAAGVVPTEEVLPIITNVDDSIANVVDAPMGIKIPDAVAEAGVGEGVLAMTAAATQLLRNSSHATPRVEAKNRTLLLAQMMKKSRQLSTRRTNNLNFL